jgi:hypothetical protein
MDDWRSSNDSAGMTGGSFTIMDQLPFQGTFTLNCGGLGISASCHSRLILLGDSDRTICIEQLESSASSTPVLDGDCARPARSDGASIAIISHQGLTSKLNAKNVAMNGFGRGCLSLKLISELFNLCECKRSLSWSNSKSEVLNSYG